MRNISKPEVITLKLNKMYIGCAPPDRTRITTRKLPKSQPLNLNTEDWDSVTESTCFVEYFP